MSSTCINTSGTNDTSTTATATIHHNIAGRLTAITRIDEVRELRDMYRHNWPAHAVGYYCLDNFLRWMMQHQQQQQQQQHQKQPEQQHASTALKHLHIYTCNSEWRQHGLLLIVDRYQLFVQCLRAEMEQSLIESLMQLDWSAGLKISSLHERHRMAVMHVINAQQLPLEYDSHTLLYYMPQSEASRLDVTPVADFVVRPLVEADAELIDELWPNRHRGSLFLIRRLIAWNANMGVYTADSNQLVAWCLRLQGGFLGALQVCDAYKRLGLGTLVARATARRIALEHGDDVMALVNPGNAPSRGMFEKLGFKVTGSCYWIRNYPTKSGLEWPDGE